MRASKQSSRAGYDDAPDGTEGDVDEVEVEGVLDADEVARNNNRDLHPFEGVKTCVECCKMCGVRVLGLGLHIHYNERHAGAVVEEADGVVDAKI